MEVQDNLFYVCSGRYVYLCANKTNSSKPTKHNFNAKKYFACGEKGKIIFYSLDVIAIIHHNARASHFGKLIASFCDAKNSFWQTFRTK